MTTPVPHSDSDLHRRARLLRRLGTLRDMLPGSFVTRYRRCGQPSCHCADGQRLHPQFQLSVLIEGQPKTFNIPARLADLVRRQVELRRQFAAAAAAICHLNLRRFLAQRRQD